MKLEGRVALITGGAHGIGRAIAVTFAQEGADIVVVDLPQARELAEEAVAEVESRGRRALYAAADIGVPADVDAAVEKARDTFTRVDILVNNAARHGPERDDPEFAEDDFDGIMGVTFKAQWRFARALAPQMIDNRYGVIINFSSVGALTQNIFAPPQTAHPFVGIYQAAKAAVIRYSMSLARQLAPHVRVNCIAPGWVNTGRFPDELLAEAPRHIPLGRVALPEDVAPVALFLASDDSRLMTGNTLIVDGGLFSRV